MTTRGSPHLTIRLPEPLNTRVRAAATLLGMDASSVCRQALEDWLGTMRPALETAAAKANAASRQVAKLESW